MAEHSSCKPELSDDANLARRCIVRVSYGILERLLEMPAAHRILSVRDANHSGPYGYFEIVCEGPSLPTVPVGGMLRTMTLQLTQVETDELVRKRTITSEFR